MSTTPTTSTAPAGRRERRWPPALAILVLITLPLLLPQHLTLGPAWLLPTIGGIFLIAFAFVDPSRTGDRVIVARALAIGLTVCLIVGGGWMTIRLTNDLIHGGPETNSPSVLLATGALVWINNSILFGLLYWELDAGGPAARVRGLRPYGDFAFPQQMNAGTGPPDWRPVFVDYLYIGVTNGLAFSPTDAMPLAIWAKLTMALQGMISFVVVGLVIARAVNILN